MSSFRTLGALTVVALAAGVLAAAPPAVAAAYVDSVDAGTRLVANDTLVSQNRAFTLTVQTDGNVVERRGATAVWTTGTTGNPGAVLDVQTDGNLVVRASSGRAVWSSGTPGHRSSSFLALEGDGELHLYDGGAYWNNGVGGSQVRTTLAAGQSVRTSDEDTYVVSPSNRIRVQVSADGVIASEMAPRYETATWLVRSRTRQHALTMQTDGNLVLRDADGRAAWSTGTRGAGNRFVVQDDGNLVVRRANGSAAWSSGSTHVLLAAGETAASGTRFVADASIYAARYVTTVQPDGNVVTRNDRNQVTWSTGTAGNSGARLLLQTDGNLVVRRPDGRAVWQSGTNGCGSRSTFDVPHTRIVVDSTTVWTAAGGSAGYC